MLRNQATEAHHVAAPERSLTATRIREAREFTGLSKEQFARTCGTTRRNLIRWEYDQHQPTHRSLRLIADAAGVSVDWLTGSTEELSPRSSSEPSRARKAESRSGVMASNQTAAAPDKKEA